MKKRCIFAALLYSLMFTGLANAQLADQYRRNGEVYFLVGKADSPLRGIYRMNNPESNANYPTGGYRYIKKNQMEDTDGFCVTLDREIYTFTKQTDPVANRYMYRQVLTGVDKDTVDLGSGVYIHCDHRSSVGAAGEDVYREMRDRTVVNVNGVNKGRIRNLNNTYSGNSCYYPVIYAIGTGDYIGSWAQVQTACPDYMYQEMSGNVRVAVYTTNNTECSHGDPNEAPWYRLDKNKFPSGYVWYSCRKSNNGRYGTIGDKETNNKIDFTLCKWQSSNVGTNETGPSYSKISSTPLGSTGGISLGRKVYAGCLDGCGGFSGSSPAVPAKLASTSVAFQPKPKGASSDRSYFYSRKEGETTYTLQTIPESLKNTATYIPSESYLGDTTTYKIGCSIKDKDNDYIYALGNNVIKRWYDAYNGTALTGHKIKSVSVSNQWEQTGGIVFAYDSKKGYVYEFIRDENGVSEKDKIKTYRALSVNTLKSGLGLGSSQNELDDIAADGYGNLYYTVSQPSGDVGNYNPPQHFTQADIIHIHQSDYDESEDVVEADAIFKQEYRKTIGKYDIQTEDVEEINRMVYASQIYAINIRVPLDLYNQIKNAPSNWYTQIRNYYSNANASVKAKIKVGGNPPNSGSLNKNWFQEGSASCLCATVTACVDYNVDNLGQTQLSVINIPTPPEVKHLGPYKVSYLDICGPYTQYPTPTIGGTNQRPADVSATALQNKNLYFFMVENYPYQSGTHSQDPRAHIDYDEDSRGSGFIATIKYPDKPLSNNGISYEWKLWQVAQPDYTDPNNPNKWIPCCELVQESDSNSLGFWQYAKGKFILCSRVRYTWYDYDNLAFGTTVDDRDMVKKIDYAWASQLNSAAAFNDWKNGSGNANDSRFSNATSSSRLDDIMNMNQFSFMKNNPKDIDGNPIYYKTRMGLNVDTTDASKKDNYWALQPIIVNGNPPPLDGKFEAKIERCDHIVKTNLPPNVPQPDASTYIYKTGSNSHWSLPPTTGDKSFVIENGRKYYWRMAIASQTKLFFDISKSTKHNYSQINDSDFNIVAYILSTPTLPGGVSNNLYMNGNSTFQFNPNELGSCWWYEKTDSNGDKHNIITADIGIEYRSPGQTQPITRPLLQNAKFDLNESHYNKPEEGLLKNAGASNLWDKYVPIMLEMEPGVLPITDPLIATISIRLTRQFKFKATVYGSDGTVITQNVVGPIPLVLEAKVNVRVIDTRPPEIIYAETPNINLYGITGKPLAITDGPGGVGGKNPQFVSFSIRDNNQWEAGNENGINLSQHVANYHYNYGSAACASYTAGSTKLESYRPSVYSSGIKMQIQNLMNLGQKTSHLNYKPMFSKQAIDTRIVFDTAGYYKSSSSKPFDGTVYINKADSFKYTYTGSNPNLGSYSTDESIFNADNSEYAYNPSIRTNNNNQLTKVSSSLENASIEGINQVTAKTVYRIPLISIKMKNGENRVPENYANNTPGYHPYNFYVRSTDCSGNYMYIPSENETDDYIGSTVLKNKALKKDCNVPINISLHVRDDIPPLGFGKVTDTKNNRTLSFPQLSPATGTAITPLETNIASITHIPSGGGRGVPEYFGITLNNSFLRAQNWYSERNDGLIKCFENLNLSANQTYKTLPSFSAKNITSKNNMVLAKGNTVSSNNVYVKALKNQVSPYYVEDNVLCNFSVSSMDNAGIADAKLYFKYYITGSEANGTAYGQATYYGTASGTKSINGVNNSNFVSGTTTTTTTQALFRGPEYPLSIPILIIAEDNAMTWDYYRSSVSSLRPNQMKNPDNLFGQLASGTPSVNRRYISTSLAVFKSGLDIRTLEKSLKNN